MSNAGSGSWRSEVQGVSVSQRRPGADTYTKEQQISAFIAPVPRAYRLPLSLEAEWIIIGPFPDVSNSAEALCALRIISGLPDCTEYLESPERGADGQVAA